MSLIAKEWRVFEHDRRQLRAFADAIAVAPVLAQALLARGIDTPEAADRFLSPSLDRVSDPMTVPGMEAAVARLRAARERGEHVRVFGDYDVDGTTGSVILAQALERLGVACSADLPDRLTEGFGMKPEHVRRAREAGATLIVTVDNGTSAHDAVAAANEAGIDVVITDHHEPPDTLPNAVAVVNPMLGPPGAPYRDNCGAAVAFKLAWALTGEQLGIDLAALGTVTDVAPLTGENRDLVAAGLIALRQAPRTGITALARVARTPLNALTAQHLAFQLGPRLNAAGRLGNAHDALELLRTRDSQQADALARTLDAANRERRGYEDKMLREAEAALARNGREPSICLGSMRWHPGVLGIVASRLQTKHNRPVLLIAFDEETGLGRGSARSIEALHLADTLAACAEHLESHGGHAAAAGLSIRRECLDAFRNAFNAAVVRALPDGAPPPPLAIDGLVSLSELDSRLVKSLERLEPCGRGNPAPVFCCDALEAVPDSARILKDRHLKFAVRQGDTACEVIGFGMHDRYELVTSGEPLDLAFTAELNTWREETKVQLRLSDIRKSIIAP